LEQRFGSIILKLYSNLRKDFHFTLIEEPQILQKRMVEHYKKVQYTHWKSEKWAFELFGLALYNQINYYLNYKIMLRLLIKKTLLNSTKKVFQITKRSRKLQINLKKMFLPKIGKEHTHTLLNYKIKIEFVQICLVLF